jgi:hypothetical protein
MRLRRCVGCCWSETNPICLNRRRPRAQRFASAIEIIEKDRARVVVLAPSLSVTPAATATGTARLGGMLRYYYREAA